ncbi:MAG: hypothetical protein HW399_880, partial [Dehalococcoidia bacterium]|nr:hypothetical protein [Dehalococcoidia bacterium]
MSPTTTTYLGIPGYVIFWGLFVLVLALFAQRAYKLWSLVRLGVPDSRLDGAGSRIK